MEKQRASRNRTIALSSEEFNLYQKKLLNLSSPVTVKQIQNRTINQNLFEILAWLPQESIDLLFLDPPYNLTKTFSPENSFQQRTIAQYQEWLESWFPRLVKVLKPTASVYICGDWRSAAAIHLTAEKYFKVRNCITWEREKGRGAKANWKNWSEQIWFCTVSDRYTFNIDAVKLKRRVMAPYTDSSGCPKDWEKHQDGNYR